MALTEALADLQAAEEAKTDFLEAAPALDSTDNVVSTNGIDVDAGEATADDIKDYYEDVAGSVGHSSNVNVAGFADKTPETQDAYIAAYETSLSADIDAAKAELPSNMTSLLETMESRKDDLIEKIEAAKSQLTDLNAEIATFNSANTSSLKSDSTDYDTVPFAEYDADTKATPGTNEVLVMDESDYDATADYSDGYLLIDGTIYTGENGSATEVAFADLEEAERSSQLVQAYEAGVSADSAVTSAETALETAIEEVVLAENDAYELAEGEDVSGFVTVAKGDADTEATVTIDLTQSVGVYETEADKDEETAEVQTLTITADDADDEGEGLNVTYGTDDSTGSSTVNVDLSAVDVVSVSAIATAVASALNGDTGFADLATASADGADVIITYDGSLEGTDVGEDVSATATGTTNGLAASGAETTSGGTGKVTSVDAADSEALKDAIAALSDFEELVAQFEEARELNTELLDLEEAIEDATAAIENDPDDVEEPGLGVTLAEFETSTATSDSEVFLFEDKEGETVEIGDFGASGEDRIFFGEGYSLVEITGDEGINGDEGNSSALEILWEEKSGDLHLFVESKPFAGNGSSDADVTTIKLAGVTADDITFEDGFLTAGTAA